MILTSKAIAIPIIWITKFLSRKYAKQLKNLPIPGELLVVIGFTLFMSFYKGKDFRPFING